MPPSIEPTPTPAPLRRLVVVTSDVCDCDLYLHARLNGDGGDLLDNIRRRVQVDQALVDAHLPTVERVGAFAVRRLPNAEAQGARGETHRTCHMKLLLPCASNQV